MNAKTICSALILGGLMVTLAPSSSPLAQSSDKNVVAPKDAGAAPAKAKTNTNTTPTKQPRWRHRGGKHPHFGSRPVRT
jgi:hypothetical protein